MTRIQLADFSSENLQYPVKPDQENPLQRLDRYIDNHEQCFERMARIRQSIKSNPSQVMNHDQILACPERFTSKTVKALIYASKYLEELAEGVSDTSGLIERLTRNLMSGGTKNDMAQVVGAGIGRVVSGYMSLPGVAVHKLAGTLLYGLSILSGGLAVAGVAALGANRKYGSDGAPNLEKGHFNSSIYEEIAGATAKGKAKVINQVLDKLDKAGIHKDGQLQRWCRHLSKDHTIHDKSNCWERRTHCNYIWKNLHQYGNVTKALMYSAYGVFQGVNKLMGSYDKYLGTEIGKRFIAKKLGTLLGLKVGLCIAVGLAAGLSVPTAPLIVGLSTISACACAFALIALVAAKLNVRYRHDWNGNFTKTPAASNPG